MAYFECTTGLGAGGGATITVTYNSSFYNKTMTCSNGTKTYTKITTSSGSTEFSVTDEGTWTIACNGVSRTVDVVLNYTTQMAITKTVTVYGAAGATISFTDTMGSKTCTLDNSGEGSASITFIPPSQSITFTDTNVSKNPDDLSQNYSKSITITESITSIKVMPDGALYWYGWISENFEECSPANGWTSSWVYISPIPSFRSPTYNTNSLGCTTASGQVTEMGTKQTIRASKVKWIVKPIKQMASNNSTILVKYQKNSKYVGNNAGVVKSEGLQNTGAIPLNTVGLIELTPTEVGDFYWTIQDYAGMDYELYGMVYEV